MVTRPVISIVDDDDYVRISLGSLLRSYGYVTHLFDSAEQFLSSDLASGTDCLVSDIQMPGMNGLRMYERLQARGINPPVIFITASPDETPRLAASQLGACGYLSKPFDGPALVACIERALNPASQP